MATVSSLVSLPFLVASFNRLSWLILKGANETVTAKEIKRLLVQDCERILALETGRVQASHRHRHRHRRTEPIYARD